MIISVVSPQAHNNGNTTTSILLAMGLAELKRKVFLTHVNAQSNSFATYLGIEAYEDKTSTPTQLVKLMREGAIQPSEIADYCKEEVDFLDVFSSNSPAFSQQDMDTLLEFMIESDVKYEYRIFDIDADKDSIANQYVIKKSDIIILNLSDNKSELDAFNNIQSDIMKLCKDKKVIIVSSAYDSKAMKLKEIAKYLNVNTTILPISYSKWVKWGNNRGKLSHVFLQGKTKDADVIEIYRNVMTIVKAISKAKITINKERQHGAKNSSKKGVFRT